jgi:VWFA-related protein
MNPLGLNQGHKFPLLGRAGAAGGSLLSSLVTIIICAELWVLALTAVPNAEAPIGAQEAAPDQTPVATLPVLVLDRDRRPVTDLTRNELELYEGKEEQSIESISRSPTAPAKIGFLVDVSPSNAASLRALKLPESADLAGGLLRAGDLAFVVGFARTASVLCPLSSDLGRVEKALHSAFNAQSRSGTTSLYDTMFWACTVELSTRTGHQALIVFSDMQDNTSNHTRDEVLAAAQPSGIVIYPILLGETGSVGLQTRGERVAKLLSDETGGVPFAVHKLEDLKETLKLIRADLDNTYFIGYRPTSHGPGSVKVRCTRKGVKIIAPGRRY